MPRSFVTSDKELRALVRAAKLGRREADLLVEVRRLDGRQSLVLVHIEVQNQVDEAFEERMFIYHYRAFDLHRPEPVCSLAILGDTKADWRPNTFRSGLWGCQVQLEFPVVKLLDLRPRLQELEQSRNPFAILTVAHFHAKASGPRSNKRLQRKLLLYERLKRSGFPEEEIDELLHLVDWVLHLSGRNAERFDQETEKLDKELEMKFVTSFEKKGIKKGKAEGLREAT